MAITTSVGQLGVVRREQGGTCRYSGSSRLPTFEDDDDVAACVPDTCRAGLQVVIFDEPELGSEYRCQPLGVIALYG